MADDVRIDVFLSYYIFVYKSIIKITFIWSIKHLQISFRKIIFIDVQLKYLLKSWMKEIIEMYWLLIDKLSWITSSLFRFLFSEAELLNELLNVCKIIYKIYYSLDALWPSYKIIFIRLLWWKKLLKEYRGKTISRNLHLVLL